MSEQNSINLEILRDTPPWDWPKGADKMFLNTLCNEGADEADRCLAAELACDFTVINDELAEVLQSILRNDDESEKLRKEAAMSLGPVLEYADTEEFDIPDDVPISENMFRTIQNTLQELYLDADVPKRVRQQSLMTSVRTPQEWHHDAILAAYASSDEEWKLTAVFGMRWVSGFDDQILESLESENEEIHHEAVCAAGDNELDAAWYHIAALITSEDTEKFLLLDAIDALVDIRPHEAGMLIYELTDSEDEDIAEAAYEAMTMAEGLSSIDEFDDEEEDEDDDRLFH